MGGQGKTQQFGAPDIAGGFLDDATTVGAYSKTVRGCQALLVGAAQWEIILPAPGIPKGQYRCWVTNMAGNPLGVVAFTDGDATHKFINMWNWPETVSGGGTVVDPPVGTIFDISFGIQEIPDVPAV